MMCECCEDEPDCPCTENGGRCYCEDEGMELLEYEDTDFLDEE